ncbi:DNA-methyltransferase [Coralloluteibacterium thermophilus]|uniref:Methyltransferase n=1 Tax=Coralloluteibacterium thermophilum TaxID=2707049 RepID=A0ABV9NEW7_9GAMM
MLYKTPHAAWNRVSQPGGHAALFVGDCSKLLSAIPDSSISLVITSPPYCMGKEYEPSNRIEDFAEAHELLLAEVARVLKPGGSACWQVGYHVQRNRVTPLDFLVYDVAQKFAPELVLRNRIMWHFGHGQHCDRRFSGRHETILWFSKGSEYTFNLDAVRVPQKYPGKRASRGPRQGEYSGNPLGKNPSDVWDIPNVKSNHVEKTDHPCQFPVALARRLVAALSCADDVVLDPFSGSGSAGVAALLEGRRFLGAELLPDYAAIARARLSDTVAGRARFRPDVEVEPPRQNSAVARRPEHFWQNQSVEIAKQGA